MFAESVALSGISANRTGVSESTRTPTLSIAPTKGGEKNGDEIARHFGGQGHHIGLPVLGFLIIGAAFIVAQADPVLTAAASLGLVLLLATVTTPKHLSSLLLVSALPFSRPNIFGDAAAVVGLGLAGGALVIALSNDLRSSTFALNRKAAPIAAWLLTGYLWLLIRGAIVGQKFYLGQYVKSLTLTMVAVAAALVVASEPHRARMVAKAVVLLTVLASASYLITSVCWLTLGTGFGEILTISNEKSYTVYFPFSITLGTQEILGQYIPRLTGYAREPGLMGMWCSFAYFLLPRVVSGRLWLFRFILIIGILGTLSVASTAVFIVTWISLQFLFHGRRTQSLLAGFLRFTLGPAALAIGYWIILYSPLVGLEEKAVRDPYSVTARHEATQAGLRALFESPLLGGGAVESLGAVNLIASIAAFGVPFMITICLAFLTPLLARDDRHALAGPLLVLLGTLLVAQPASGSVWIYVAAVIAVSVISPAQGGQEGVRPRSDPSAVHCNGVAPQV